MNELLRPPTSRRARRDHSTRILLTGASGVVGSAAVPRLNGAEITCLTHRAVVSNGRAATVRGDITAPHLGLDRGAYTALAARTDVVVHCAAVTQFNRDDGSLEATNVGGTESIVAFAEDAGAHLVHVSSAYLNASASEGGGQESLRYAISKRAAEDVVRSAGVPYAILRPSIVIGDSVTGHLSAFQGLHLVAGAVMDGLVPVAPFDPAWLLDFIPADVVADCIAAVVAERITGDHWITAGRDALPLETAMATVNTVADELGAPVAPVRFVPPDLYDRLFAPVFLDALPRPIKFTIVKLFEFFTAYLSVDEPLPSDVHALMSIAGRDVPDPQQALLTSLRYWAEATGRVSTLEVA